MDAVHRDLVKKLRNMGSSDAATWLLENCPLGSANVGSAYRVIPHLSWKRPDQFRLARHYLNNLPHAHPGAYRGFASFMSLRNFLLVVEENMSEIADDRLSLLFYYLLPILKAKSRSADNKALVADFIKRHGAG